MSIGTKFMETLRQQLSAAQLRGDTALDAVRAINKGDILAHSKAQRLGMGAQRPNDILRSVQTGDKNIVSMLMPRAQSFQQRINQASTAHQSSPSTSNSMTATSPVAIR